MTNSAHLIIVQSLGSHAKSQSRASRGSRQGRSTLAAALVITILASASVPAVAIEHQRLAGTALVVDGDTIDLGSERVRLEGIDAPEAAQTCKTATGQSWPCGQRATAKLRELIGSKAVECERQGQDKYGRALAFCFANGRNLNEAMVTSGYAWAFVKYSRVFTNQEAAARSAKAGVWQGDAQAPWDFRGREWAVAEASAPGKCAIKGNISDGGYIYHVPWSTWYDRVRIDTSRGEKWFCSEAEAIAAGWRAAVSN